MNAGTFACVGRDRPRLGERRARPASAAPSHAGAVRRAARRAWRARASSAARPARSAPTRREYDRALALQRRAHVERPDRRARRRSAAPASAAAGPPPPPRRAPRPPRGSRRSGPRPTNQCSGAHARQRRRRAARAPVSASKRARAVDARRRVTPRDSRSPIRSCSRASGRGAHQFHSPSSFISDGTSSARTIVASISTASAVPEPELLDEDHLRRHERADRDAEQDRGRGHDPAGPLQPDGHRLVVGQPAVARLLDPREQEHAVVGREPERDREQQDRLRGLQRALARVAEQALQPAVLEDQLEDPERGAQRQQVHDQRLDGQHDRAGHQEQDDERRRREDRQREPGSGPRAPTAGRGTPPSSRRPAPGTARRRRARPRPRPWRTRRAACPRATTPIRHSPPAATRLLDGEHARELAEPLGVGARPRPRPTRARARRRRSASSGSAGTRSRSASSTTRAECDVAEHARVEAGELDLGERQPERDQQHRGRPPRPAAARRITQRESRYQKPDSSRGGLASHRRAPARRRERVRRAGRARPAAPAGWSARPRRRRA